MSFLGLMLRAGLRHRWRSWLALALLTALAVGLVLAGAQTARRTATAFPRFQAAHGYDGFFYATAPVPGASSLPGVESVTAEGSIISGAPECACSRSLNNTNDFSVNEVAPAGLGRLVKLVSGRMPNQSDPTEVLASTDLQPYGIHVGSVLRLPLAAASQRNEVLTFANMTPDGPVATVRVVGLSVSEAEFTPGSSSQTPYDLYTTQAFDKEFNARSVLLYQYFFRLRGGAAGLPQFQAAAKAQGALSVTDLDALSNSIQTSIDPQAVGWWILTGLAALVGLVVLAQALSRQAALDAEDNPSLAALGATRRQLFTFTMARTLLLAVVGAGAGIVLAAALSVFVPVGEARLADPNPGFDFDALLLLGGALAAVGVLLLLGVWPAVRASRTRSLQDQGRVTRPSRTVAWLSASGAPPTALIGVRNALERGRGRNAVPVSSALIGAVLAVAVLCGTAVFGASLAYLTDTPSQYGQGFDAWFTTNVTGATSQTAQLLASLERPGVTAITAGVSGVVRINGSVVDALAGQSVRGPLTIPPTAGRWPVANDEVVLGAKTMREVGTHLGGTVSVALPTASGGVAPARPFRVVGTAVLPPDFINQGLGTGAIFSLGALAGETCRGGGTDQACLVSAVTAGNGSFLVQVAPDARGRAALSALSNEYQSTGQLDIPYPPTDLVNFGRAVNFPLIFGLVVIVFGVATLLHLLLTSLSRRRREMGLLKSLGFVRHQLALSVSWQTTTVAVVGLVIGIPLGIAAGRVVWSAFADNLGVGTQPVVTVSEIALLALGVLVVANLLAVVPAVVAARARPASLLRTE
jgi:hypothetical protein